MNLWQFFPEQLVRIDGILSLPYLVLPLYFVLVLFLFKAPSQRITLFVFLLLSLATSVWMLLSMGPNINSFLLPLLLLLVFLMPLFCLLYAIYRRNQLAVKVWVVASIAGFLHGLSWAVWLTALAGS